MDGFVVLKQFEIAAFCVLVLLILSICKEMNHVIKIYNYSF